MNIWRAMIRCRVAVCKAVFWFYHNGVSPFLPISCRFYPTCSTYARDAVLRFGLLKGGVLTLRRLLRCHPFYRGDLYDPVPENKVADVSQGYERK